MRIKMSYILSLMGWTLLVLIIFPICVSAASIHIKRGYSNQPLSEYETCLTLTAEDITNGKVMFNSDRIPVFLGDRWQLCWIHGCTVQNLIEVCEFEDITAIESINLENRMIFTGEEIFDGSSRMHYLEASSAMYYDADGSLKIQDFGYDVSFWTPEALVLFYDVEDIPIGSPMDSYYDSSIIARRWGEFARKASSIAIIKDCLEQGLTLFYGQLSPFDVNRPVEGIHTVYVTLKGSKPSSEAENGDSSGDDGNLSNKNPNASTEKTQNNKINKKTTTNKKTTKKKTIKKKNTNQSNIKEKNSNQGYIKNTTTAMTREIISNDNSVRSEGYAPIVTNPSTSTVTESGQADDIDLSDQKEKDIEEQTPRKFSLKSVSKAKELKTTITEMEPDPKAVPLLGLCMLAGIAFGLLRFRMQMKGGIL